jgi:hypothetical protein
MFHPENLTLKSNRSKLIRKTNDTYCRKLNLSKLVKAIKKVKASFI